MVLSDKKHKNGFTLFELMVVILIMAVIAGIGGYYFVNSKEKAKVTEVEKNARHMKDYLDIQSFNSKPKIDHLSYFADGKHIYKLSDFDNIKTTNHFMGDKIPDTSAVYDCQKPTKDCYVLDGNSFKGSFLIYFIGKSTKCNLDETVYQNDTSSDPTVLPTHFYTKEPKWSPSSSDGWRKYRRYNKIEVTVDGQKYESNYCMMPIQADLAPNVVNP